MNRRTSRKLTLTLPQRLAEALAAYAATHQAATECIVSRAVWQLLERAGALESTGHGATQRAARTLHPHVRS
jgi:hypothetical protein